MPNVRLLRHLEENGVFRCIALEGPRTGLLAEVLRLDYFSIRILFAARTQLQLTFARNGYGV